MPLFNDDEAQAQYSRVINKARAKNASAEANLVRAACLQASQAAPCAHRSGLCAGPCDYPCDGGAGRGLWPAVHGRPQQAQVRSPALPRRVSTMASAALCSAAVLHRRRGGAADTGLASILDLTRKRGHTS